MPKKPPEIPTWRGHYAGFASRLVAVVIDLLILAVSLAVSTMLYNVVFVNLSTFYQIVSSHSVPSLPALSVAVTVFIVFITFAVYFIFLWTAIGSTIGGVIIGLRIVNSQGKNPTVWQSTIRFMTEFFIPIIGLIGCIWIIFSKRRRALFDRFAGTFVIYDWDAKPDEKFLKKATNQITGFKEVEGPK
jgi:uncharacterized RDD family membrane protein YckC